MFYNFDLIYIDANSRKSQLIKNNNYLKWKVGSIHQEQQLTLGVTPYMYMPDANTMRLRAKRELKSCCVHLRK